MKLGASDYLADISIYETVPAGTILWSGGLYPSALEMSGTLLQYLSKAYLQYRNYNVEVIWNPTTTFLSSGQVGMLIVPDPNDTEIEDEPALTRRRALISTKGAVLGPPYQILSAKAPWPKGMTDLYTQPSTLSAPLGSFNKLYVLAMTDLVVPTTGPALGELTMNWSIEFVRSTLNDATTQTLTSSVVGTGPELTPDVSSAQAPSGALSGLEDLSTTDMNKYFKSKWLRDLPAYSANPSKLLRQIATAKLLWNSRGYDGLPTVNLVKERLLLNAVLRAVPSGYMYAGRNLSLASLYVAILKALGSLILPQPLVDIGGRLIEGFINSSRTQSVEITNSGQAIKVWGHGGGQGTTVTATDIEQVTGLTSAVTDSTVAGALLNEHGQIYGSPDLLVTPAATTPLTPSGFGYQPGRITSSSPVGSVPALSTDIIQVGAGSTDLTGLGWRQAIQPTTILLRPGQYFTWTQWSTPPSGSAAAAWNKTDGHLGTIYVDDLDASGVSKVALELATKIVPDPGPPTETGPGRTLHPSRNCTTISHGEAAAWFEHKAKLHPYAPRWSDRYRKHYKAVRRSRKIKKGSSIEHHLTLS